GIEAALTHQRRRTRGRQCAGFFPADQAWTAHAYETIVALASECAGQFKVPGSKFKEIGKFRQSEFRIAEFYSGLPPYFSQMQRIKRCIFRAEKDSNWNIRHFQNKFRLA